MRVNLVNVQDAVTLRNCRKRIGAALANVIVLTEA